MAYSHNREPVNLTFMVAPLSAILGSAVGATFC